MDEDENITEKLLDVTEMAIETLDLDDEKDLKIILGLLDCCKSSVHVPNQPKKRLWVKQWRADRIERGSLSVDTNGLSSEMMAVLNSTHMNLGTFNYILSRIENDIRRKDTLMRKSISPAEKLAATLRYLVTGESYKSTNYKTKISDSVLSTAIPEVCAAIWKHFKDEFLKFPASRSEWEFIAANFAAKWQFPHCLGALDSKHIIFQSLKNSIVLLALVDADCRFIYIDVECDGTYSDAEVLLQSDLRKIIDNAEKYFPAGKQTRNGKTLPYVIIGDNAFSLEMHIMTPYSHKTSRKPRQIFNIRLERARHVVEQAFDILSSRFKIIQHKVNLSVEKVKLITKTCCVLHNLLSHKSPNYLNLTSPAETSILAPVSTSGTNIPNPEAQRVRRAFEEYFHSEGKILWQEIELNQSENTYE